MPTNDSANREFDEMTERGLAQGPSGHPCPYDAVGRISEAASLSASLDELITRLHRIVAEVMPARNMYLAQFHSKIARFAYPYWVDERDPQPVAFTLARRGLTALVMRRGRTLLVTGDEIHDLQRRGDIELLGAVPRSYLAVPLRARARTLGVLAVQVHDADLRSYDHDDARLLELAGACIAKEMDLVAAQIALQTSEERYRALVENATDIIYSHDLAGRVTSVSRAVERCLGYPPEELVGRDLAELLAPNEPRSATPLTWADGARRGTVAVVARGGKVVQLEDCAWIAHQDGNPSVVHGVARDATTRLELEDQLRSLQKMEAIGRLAAGVAHDFNNILSVIQTAADSILLSSDSADHVRERTESIADAAGRGAGLTRQLLALSRKQVPSLRLLDLDREIRGLAPFLERMLGESSRLALHLDDGTPSVMADVTWLAQVLTNLVVNARDAMPRGGTVTIAVAGVAEPPPHRVCLRVTDDGTGMAPELVDRIFEPFFTTKARDTGTGLGLPTVHGIITQLGGSIDVASALGQGTTFTIWLPAVGREGPAG
jgi:PAS domain S-box-containing protein